MVPSSTVIFQPRQAPNVTILLDAVIHIHLIRLIMYYGCLGLKANEEVKLTERGDYEQPSIQSIKLRNTLRALRTNDCSAVIDYGAAEFCPLRGTCECLRQMLNFVPKDPSIGL